MCEKKPQRVRLVCAAVCWIWLSLGAEISALPRKADLSLAVAPGGALGESGVLIARAKKTSTKKSKKGGKGESPAAEAPAEPEAAPAAAGAPGGEGAGTQPLGLSGSNRVEFDAQMIKGQVTKAGEVQVLERKETEIKSLVKRRSSFREEIIKTVFPEKQQ